MIPDDKETFGQRHEDEDERARKAKEEETQRQPVPGVLQSINEPIKPPDLPEPPPEVEPPPEELPEGERHRVEIGGVLQPPGTRPKEPEGSGSIEDAKVKEGSDPDILEGEIEDTEDDDDFKPTHRGAPTRTLPKNRKK